MLGKPLLASCCASERAMDSLLIGALEAGEILERTLLRLIKVFSGRGECKKFLPFFAP